MKEQNYRLCYSGLCHHILRDHVVQDMRPRMNRQEAKIESQKAGIESLQTDLKSTLGTLNNWDEVHLNSIQGVHVDDSIGTSLPSVSRVTEAAISHPPQAGVDLDRFHLKEHSVPKAARKIGCSPDHATSEQIESSIGSTQFIYAYDFFAD